MQDSECHNTPTVSGGSIEEDPPDPIPNSDVKLFGANGTAREAVWESRSLPGLLADRVHPHAASAPFLLPSCEGGEAGRFFFVHMIS